MTRICFYILLYISLTFSFCGNRHEGEQKPTLLSNALSITDNEDRGVKEILEFYGGQCKYGFGVSASTDKGKKKYFKLEMSKGVAIEQFSKDAEMPASNVAYLFYRNLKEEKNNYDEIHTIIIFNDNSKKTFEFSKEKLEIVDKKMNLVNRVVEFLKAKEFDSLRTILNPDTSFIRYDRTEFIAELIKAESQFGNIEEFVNYGFRFNNLKDGREILHISGVLNRDKEGNEFSIDIDPTSSKNEVILIQYKL